MADLQLQGIQKSYGAVSVIRDVDLHVADGEFCVFIGPSGCGKSTLLRMIAGLEDITDGELRIGGRRVNEVPPAQRGVAMVFQSYALFPHLTVRQNMAFGLELARRPRDEIERRVGEAARLLQLDALLDRKPRQLSGGQRQRVAIGRAIVRDPGVFLFDEPLSNLDAALRVQTRMEIARLHRAHGRAAMVYVTHDQVEAMTMADRILLLNAGPAVATEGSVAQVGTPLELYQRPRTRFVAGFIGSPKMNFLAATLVDAQPALATLALPEGTQLQAAVDARRLAPGAPVTLGLRPEHALLGTAVQHLVRPLLWQERLGDSTCLYLDSGDGAAPWTVRAPGNSWGRPGQRLAFGLPPNALHLFDEQGLALPRSVSDDDLQLPEAA
ncbi:ABC transporter ATP-binding protein [Rubrivivax albus]|uniref:sn-glycerol-3-phosphate ABC transporter ATP-binding protein UgpC n=1 Tax=Rubrivivax albus TaxID=2499835 RepID=A0A3S2WYX8_9BURK|nr:sn-glycerol-3-phosphate ABC transporter ATP-binding protein UgpC [Rubrivivax albus]RVT49421.1 sn-glycerol-3-phosphate ABC transporter ATP-binding protein UgpC [Rubrivivax albus]